MIKKRAFFLLALVLSAPLSAGGMKEARILPLEEISGIVRLVGNEPFVNLLLTDEEGRDYYFSKEYFERFSQYSQKKIRLRARIRVEPVYRADGKFITNKYFLIDPEVSD
jgi:hypothetical protein